MADGRAAGASERFVAAGYSRHPSDLLRLVLGLFIVFLTTLPIHAASIGPWETDVFRLVNDLPLPGWTDPGVWLIMQLGVIGAVPLVAVLALATRRLRLAVDAVVAAGSIYLLAKVIKEFVKRGRPQTLLDNVHIMGEPARGLGYVSGHSAVAVALATVASPYLSRRWRRVAWGLALAVCLARMYVGAHLPLDVLGGAALGWAAGALTHLVLGAPNPRVSLSKVRKVLAEHGLDAADLVPIGPSRRRSAHFVTDGLFVKVVAREWRDTDLLYRGWRALRGRRVRPSRHGLPLHEVEHEASLALLALAGGVRTPQVLLVRSFGNGAGLLAERRIEGGPLSDLAAAPLDDGLAAELWRQVDLLHEAGIVHGELTPDNIVVDAAGDPWLVDFDQATVSRDQRLQAGDRAMLTRVTGARPESHPEPSRADAEPV
jgi:glycosyltransferase 2 family protein